MTLSGNCNTNVYGQISPLPLTPERSPHIYIISHVYTHMQYVHVFKQHKKNNKMKKRNEYQRTQTLGSGDWFIKSQTLEHPWTCDAFNMKLKTETRKLNRLQQFSWRRSWKSYNIRALALALSRYRRRRWALCPSKSGGILLVVREWGCLPGKALQHNLL